MSLVRYLLLYCFLIIFPFNVFAANDISTIQTTTNKWAEAIASRDPQKITALYDKNALLYATFSNLIDTQAGLRQYFTKLTKHQNLKVSFNKQTIRMFDDVAINSGLYTFSYTEHGKTVKVPGRYTFVYHETPAGWMIIDHHSSVMPEAQ